MSKVRVHDTAESSLAASHGPRRAELVHALALMVCKSPNTGSRVRRESDARFCERLLGAILATMSTGSPENHVSAPHWGIGKIGRFAHDVGMPDSCNR
jgi:hypothetical protein